MKVVHVLKKIELIDNDIKDLRKLEKTIARNKSFSTPIVMSIEKQVNILLGERIKLLELRIENPPENFIEEAEAPAPVEELRAKKKPQAAAKKAKAKPQDAPRKDDDDADLMMLTQDLIDEKINKIKAESQPKKAKQESPKKDEILSGGDLSDNTDHIKLLDIALEKGGLKKQDIDRDKEKKVRFFRENFPVE